MAGVTVWTARLSRDGRRVLCGAPRCRSWPLGLVDRGDPGYTDEPQSGDGPGRAPVILLAPYYVEDGPGRRRLTRHARDDIAHGHAPTLRRPLRTALGLEAGYRATEPPVELPCTAGHSNAVTADVLATIPRRMIGPPEPPPPPSPSSDPVTE